MRIGAVGSAALRPLSGAVLTTLDAVLASRLAGEVVDRVVASPVAERAVSRALAGPLVEQLAQDLVRYAVLERAAETLLDGDAIDRVADAALESPAMERLVARILESDEVWVLVDEIAGSPQVTRAISQQGMGFADQVAGGVRARSRNADAWLERGARRALRRKPPEGPGAEGPVSPGA